MADWLRTSIPGLILIGTLGSLAALLLLRLVKLLTKRLLFPLGLRLLVPIMVRPLLQAAALTKRFVNRSEDTKLIVYAINTIGLYFLRFGLLTLLVLTTIIYFVYAGPRLTGVSFALMSLSGLLFILVVRDLFASAGILAVLLLNDLREVKRILKDDKAPASEAFEFFEGIVKENRKPNTQSPGPASPPAG